MRIAAVDWGRKRIGLALSDTQKKIAFPLQVVAGGKQGIAEVIRVLKSKDVELILIGLPLHLNGKEEDAALKVREFGMELEEKSNIPIQFIDERFSSRLADQSLKEIHLNRKERTAKIDITAAAILLQEYLDQQRA